MVHKLYSIRDRAASQFGPVFQAVNDAVAARAMVRLMEKIPSYDRDAFQLVRLGSFDDETGNILVTGCDVVDYSMPRFEDVHSREFDFGMGAD
nr:MAG: nonstructural protein [Microvirus sp.]